MFTGLLARPGSPIRFGVKLSCFATLALSLLCGTLSTAGAALPRKPPAWVLAPPAPSTQVERTTAERGVNPCAVPDPGFGGYSPWKSAGASGYVLIPQKLREKKSAAFDLVVHFHGREAARKHWVGANSTVVVVGIDLGLGSGAYLKRYEDPTAFPRLLESVRRVVAEQTGRADIKRRKLALMSWSAGYGATMRVLLNPKTKKSVDAVILLDGLHTSVRNGRLTTPKLEPFAEFARQASVGDKMMYVSHSSIVPPTYASTTTSSNFLVWRLGGRPQATTKGTTPLGLEPISRFQRGDFLVRGFKGNGKKDHCAHLGLIASDVLPALQKRWRTP